MFDIWMAFFIALFIEWVYVNSKFLGEITILTIYIGIISAYYIHGCKINFVGEVDFAVWIIFVLLFNKIIKFVVKKIAKHIKE